MKDDRPWVKWDVAEWLLDVRVRALPRHARDCYHDLICYAWRERGIPADPSALARLLGEPVRRFLRRDWPLIEPFWSLDQNSGLLVQGRLERTRADADAKSETAAENARRGVESRRARESGPDSSAPAADEEATPTSGAAKPEPTGSGPRADAQRNRSGPAAESQRIGSGRGAGGQLSETEEWREGADPIGSAQGERARAPGEPTGSGSGTEPPANGERNESRRRGKAHPNRQAVIDAFHAGFLARTGDRYTWPPKAREAADRLADLLPLADVLQRMQRFFGGSPAWIWRDAGAGNWPDVLSFERVIGQLAGGADPPAAARASPPSRASGVSAEDALDFDVESARESLAAAGRLQVRHPERTDASAS